MDVLANGIMQPNAWRALGKLLTFAGKVSDDICFLFYQSEPDQGINPSNPSPMMAVRAVHQTETIFSNISFTHKFFSDLSFAPTSSPEAPLFFWLSQRSMQPIFTHKQESIREVRFEFSPLSLHVKIEMLDASSIVTYAVRCTEHDTPLSMARYPKAQSDVTLNAHGVAPTLSRAGLPGDSLRTSVSNIGATPSGGPSGGMDPGMVTWGWEGTGLTLRPGGLGTAEVSAEHTIPTDLFSPYQVVASSFKTDVQAVSAFLAMAHQMSGMASPVTLRFLPPPAVMVLTIDLHNVVEVDLVMSTELVTGQPPSAGSGVNSGLVGAPHSIIPARTPGPPGATPVASRRYLERLRGPTWSEVTPGGGGRGWGVGDISGVNMSANQTALEGSQTPTPGHPGAGVGVRGVDPPQGTVRPNLPPPRGTPRAQAGRLGAQLMAGFSGGAPSLFPDGHARAAPAHFTDSLPANRKFVEVGAGAGGMPEHAPPMAFDTPHPTPVDPHAHPSKRTTHQATPSFVGTQISDVTVAPDSAGQSRVLAGASQSYSQIRRMRPEALPELNAMFSESESEGSD